MMMTPFIIFHLIFLIFIVIIFLCQTKAILGFPVQSHRFGTSKRIKNIHQRIYAAVGNDEFSNKNIIPHSRDGLIDVGITRTRNSFDNRDFLPFTIYHTDKPLIEIGTFMLDSSTACGDVLELGERGVYKVKRVIFLYKHDGRKYRVVRKKLEVSSSTTLSNKGSRRKSKQEDIYADDDSNSNDGSIEEVLLSDDVDNNKYLQ